MLKLRLPRVSLIVTHCHSLSIGHQILMWVSNFCSNSIISERALIDWKNPPTFFLHLGRHFLSHTSKSWMGYCSIHQWTKWLPAIVSQSYVYRKSISYVTPRQKALLGKDSQGWFFWTITCASMEYENNLGHLIYRSHVLLPLAEVSGLYVGEAAWTQYPPLSTKLVCYLLLTYVRICNTKKRSANIWPWAHTHKVQVWSKEGPYAIFNCWISCSIDLVESIILVCNAPCGCLHALLLHRRVEQ